MNNKLGSKLFLNLIVFLFVLMCLSCVCAHDVDATMADSHGLNDTSAILVSNDGGHVEDVGTAKELDMDIQSLSPGDTYNFEKDYYFNDSSSNSRFYTGIVIKTDNVTLNGNGHVIEGNLAAIFKVESNNVIISNLSIINTNTSRYSCNLISEYYEVSPINWLGDNGVLSDCEFCGNSAINGGTLRWSGNNGTINNTKFINNTALGVGGAIFIMGVNTTIANSVFYNSSSLYSEEAIYITLKSKNILLKNNSFIGYNGTVLVDGRPTDIDPDWFYELVYDDVFDKNLNLYEILYRSMLTKKYVLNTTWVSEISYVDKDLKYNIEYNGTDFYINFNKIFDNFDNKYKSMTLSTGQKIDTDLIARGDLILGKSYHLQNVYCMNDIFKSLHEKEYLLEATAIAEYTIQKYADLSVLNKISYDAIVGYLDAYSDLKFNAAFLNIILSNQTYHTNGYGNIFDRFSKYSGIVLNGNGSVIVGPYKNDEDNQWTCFKINNKNAKVSIKDLTIKGFNHGIFIDEDGNCILSNVKFIDNYCNYGKEHDWGGAILNCGVCSVGNCTFIKNHAKYGGAIYNQGILFIDNMTQFIGNTAYSSGNEITFVDSAVIFFNGVKYEGHAVDLKFSNGTYFADYHNGFTESGRIQMLITSGVLSFAGGFTVGFAMGNPVVGLVMGAGVGLSIGCLMAIYVVSNNYDYHVSNVNTFLLFGGVSAAAGMVGGFLGGLASIYAPHGEPESQGETAPPEKQSTVTTQKTDTTPNPPDFNTDGLSKGDNLGVKVDSSQMGDTIL